MKKVEMPKFKLWRNGSSYGVMTVDDKIISYNICEHLRNTSNFLPFAIEFVHRLNKYKRKIN